MMLHNAETRSGGSLVSTGGTVPSQTEKTVTGHSTLDLSKSGHKNYHRISDPPCCQGIVHEHPQNPFVLDFQHRLRASKISLSIIQLFSFVFTGKKKINRTISMTS